MISSELLTSLGIDHQRKGAEFVLDCPYCGKDRHLYLNVSGAFKCHHCSESGGWARLRKEYGAIPSIQAPKDKPFSLPSEEYVRGCSKKLLGPSGASAVEYLYRRKIALEQIHSFRLGMDTKNGQPVLVIPTFEDGKPVNIKYRTIPPAEKQFFRWPGGKSALFNADILKTLKDDDPVFVTEGEIDAITLSGMGFPAVGITGGAGTINPEWIEQLERFKKIVLVYDSDNAGRGGARKIARRIGLERCYNVILPTKDVNEFVTQEHTKDEFQRLVAEARQFDVENVCSIHQAFADLSREYDKQHDATCLSPHWPSVEKLTGDFQAGDLIVVSAKEKTGKTTWVLNMAHQWAKQGHPVLFYCLEMRPSRLVRKLIQIVLRKRDEELTPKVLLDGYREIAEYPLFWGYNYKKVAADVVFETIRLAWKRYGIEAVVFDNLHYLARDITHQVQEVGYISRSFKLLAEELEIPIILIAQPRKIQRNGIMGIEDLKDSSSIGADSDQVIILYREKTKATEGGEASFKPETLIRVDASRYKPGGETLLYFDGATGTYAEIAGSRVTADDEDIARWD
ncbi:DnaB-like helicase C-terminal domain-containing protein [Syntrophorhabdus aromaticivorans]|uniref:DnaB-like helicase C-terminal domain-containing protein n=1 Tax=Syntrophorhabdus aromaticivorans TaxID=328301 RepID=UPI0003F6ADC0|nr:DnaB-like helicase C-terminal domain-containing protein [Syntrophorhabdus aromaticivorans]